MCLLTSTSAVSPTTAATVFPSACESPATNDLPCSSPMIDNGTFNSANITNGTQYFVRVDKYFKNDRIYGSFFRTLQSQPNFERHPAILHHQQLLAARIGK